VPHKPHQGGGQHFHGCIQTLYHWANKSVTACLDPAVRHSDLAYHPNQRRPKNRQHGPPAVLRKEGCQEQQPGGAGESEGRASCRVQHATGCNKTTINNARMHHTQAMKDTPVRTPCVNTLRGTQPPVSSGTHTSHTCKLTLLDQCWRLNMQARVGHGSRQDAERHNRQRGWGVGMRSQAGPLQPCKH
jgi:hypothetical protein